MIEAADSQAARAAATAGRPTQLEMQVGEPWLEEGLLRFHLNGGPYITEFRRVGPDEAVVGAAVNKLPIRYSDISSAHPTRAFAPLLVGRLR